MKCHTKVSRYWRNKNPKQTVKAVFKFPNLVLLPMEFIFTTNARKLFFLILLKFSHSWCSCNGVLFLTKPKGGRFTLNKAKESFFFNTLKTAPFLVSLTKVEKKPYDSNKTFFLRASFPLNYSCTFKKLSYKLCCGWTNSFFKG